MIISSKLAPGTTVATGVGSTPTPRRSLAVHVGDPPGRVDHALAVGVVADPLEDRMRTAASILARSI